MIWSQFVYLKIYGLPQLPNTHTLTTVMLLLLFPIFKWHIVTNCWARTYYLDDTVCLWYLPMNLANLTVCSINYFLIDNPNCKGAKSWLRIIWSVIRSTLPTAKGHKEMNCKWFSSWQAGDFNNPQGFMHLFLLIENNRLCKHKKNPQTQICYLLPRYNLALYNKQLWCTHKVSQHIA